MKQRWVQSKQAAKELGINLNALHQRISCERHINKNVKTTKKENGKLYVDMNNFKGVRSGRASDERRHEIELLYYECMEKFNDDEIKLISEAYKHGSISRECMRKRIEDFTFTSNRVCDEMEQVFKSILKEKA